MKKLYTISLFLFLHVTITYSQNSTSKINFGEFKEPSGSYNYILIDPSLRLIDNYSGAGKIRFFQTSNKELSILRTNPSVEFNKSFDSKNYSISLKPFIEVTKYLNKRNGLFINLFSNSEILREKEAEKEANFEWRTENSLSIGLGRLENISTVFQLRRILKANPELQLSIDPEDQNLIFKIAKEIRKIDYLFLRDLRRRDVKRLERFFTIFEENNVDISSAKTIANLVDGYFYSRFGRNDGPTFGPQFVFLPSNGLQAFVHRRRDQFVRRLMEGTTINIGMTSVNYSESDNFLQSNRNYLSLGVKKGLSLSDYFRISGLFQQDYFLNANNTTVFEFEFSIRFIPDARKSLTVGFEKIHARNSSNSSNSNQYYIQSNYFLNYNSALYLRFNYYSKNSYFANNYFELIFQQYLY